MVEVFYSVQTIAQCPTLTLTSSVRYNKHCVFGLTIFIFDESVIGSIETAALKKTIVCHTMMSSNHFLSLGCSKILSFVGYSGFLIFDAHCFDVNLLYIDKIYRTYIKHRLLSISRMVCSIFALRASLTSVSEGNAQKIQTTPNYMMLIVNSVLIVDLNDPGSVVLLVKVRFL